MPRTDTTLPVDGRTLAVTVLPGGLGALVLSPAAPSLEHIADALRAQIADLEVPTGAPDIDVCGWRSYAWVRGETVIVSAP